MNAAGKGPITCAGAILAGGRSSRMGQPKQFMRLPDDRTVIQAVLDALRPVCETVLIAGDADTLPELPHIADASPGRGPLAGIRSLLASRHADHYLVCPCDAPLLTADLLRSLLQPVDSILTVFREEGAATCQPLPMRIADVALPLVDEELNQGKGAIHALIARASAHVIDITADQFALLQSVNTPSDFRAMFPSPPVPSPASRSSPPRPPRPA